MLVATYTNGLGAPECDHDLVLRREMEGSWFLGNQMPVNAVLLCRERETGVYERFGVGRVYEQQAVKEFRSALPQEI